MHNVGFKDLLAHSLFGIKDHVLKFRLNIGPFCIIKAFRRGTLGPNP